MPSLRAYTPYETLVVCQSIARHGSDGPAFEDLAAALNSNALIRDDHTYDQSRLTATALQELYKDLLAEEAHAQANTSTLNGDNASKNINPRKRKLSASPAPSEDDERSEATILELLVDKLYTRFREQTIKEIRQEEEAYERIQAELTALEEIEADEQDLQDKPKSEEVKSCTQSQPVPEQSTEALAPKVQDVQPSPDAAAAAQLHASLDASRPAQVLPKATGSTAQTTEARPLPSTVRAVQPYPLVASLPPARPSPGAASTRPIAEQAQVRPSQSPAHPQHPSPVPYQRALQSPSPQRPGYGHGIQHPFQAGPQGQQMPVLSPAQGIPHMPPPTEYPSQKRGSSSSGQGRGSPIPMQPQPPFPGFQGYPPPQWHQPPHPQHQYPQPGPYANAPYYVQSPDGRPALQYQTPHHPPYQAYPQGTPIQYWGQPLPPHGSYPQSGQQPLYGYHGSPNVTPLPRSDSRQPSSRTKSSTPWKRRSDAASSVRQSSPVRPERDVSPLTDVELSSRSSNAEKLSGKATRKNDDSLLSAGDASASRGRHATSATPSAFAVSRSQSIASIASDTPTVKRKRGRPSQKIKAEPPSTPAPISDIQPTQQSSGRRGRPRQPPATKNEVVRTATATKRKRSLGRDSVSPSLPSPAPTKSSHHMLHDSSLVGVSKSFAKTSQLLLNDIVAHKLASIFAKPLSERDAPGYKDLIVRPQDLKSIKAAISKGGRAALAAIEALEAEDRSGGETPNKGASGPVPEPVERALGHGVYLVKASDDLMPPKGIVNSSQLEMELVRVFANAVMFNPLPSSERGFGSSLRLMKEGGHVDPDRDSEDAVSSEEGASLDEGGIISDAREMFYDVLARVRKWREAEVERLGRDDGAGTGSKTVLLPGTQGSAGPSVRHSSTSSALNDDDGGGDSGAASTPIPASSTARKRRRIADN